MSEAIYTYTSDQATDDGILFDIRKVNSKWERGIFSHVTVNLMAHGYYNEDDTVNLPNLLDLLNQSLQIVKRESKNFTKHDWFFEGQIELPSGTKQQVFICQNETAKYTIMTPSDY
jgi:hypothetical protein